MTLVIKRKIRELLQDYALLDSKIFHYRLPKAQYRRKWELFGWPKHIIEQIGWAKNRLKAAKKRYLMEMNEEQDAFMSLIAVVEKEVGGEFIAMSPYKKIYREMWYDSRDYYLIASYALSSMLANHFASMMDALILSKFDHHKITNLSAKTYFSPFNPYGIGGIIFSFNYV